MTIIAQRAAGVDATKAWNIAAQEGEATRIDLGIARELAKKPGGDFEREQ